MQMWRACQNAQKDLLSVDFGLLLANVGCLYAMQCRSVILPLCGLFTSIIVILDIVLCLSLCFCVIVLGGRSRRRFRPTRGQGSG